MLKIIQKTSLGFEYSRLSQKSTMENTPIRKKINKRNLTTILFNNFFLKDIFGIIPQLIIIIFFSVSCQKVDFSSENDTTVIAEENISLDDAYTVSEFITAVDSGILTSGTQSKLVGYIVGVCKNSINNAFFTSEDVESVAVASNILLADSKSQTDPSACVPVELKNGSTIRSAINLSDNPTSLGRRILLIGSAETYFKVAGLKSLQSYAWLADQETTDDDTNTDSSDDSTQTETDNDNSTDQNTENDDIQQDNNSDADTDTDTTIVNTDTLLLNNDSAIIHGGRLSSFNRKNDY